ncbi:inorganic pyrophosphatase [Histomonas meleagridis]|uniref:inorganic pyrophosphatase n=1 Tax=Histomonas meleagridis TaxID=135588 RepID=UPI003559C1F5|nr:inorganic pyrophosphatase [Histomonas meleagridis]KAH0800906.1 inorganic pyrophosphatase [Histomonas meleagridis]
MSNEIVLAPEKKEDVVMKDGIRVNQSEIEYQKYMDQLYEELEKGKSSSIQVSPERTLMMHHPLHCVEIGSNFPDIINAIIEIPAFSRVKTELDIQTGLLKVDRILHSSVVYPANYGFIPKTIADNGDPLDILVLCQVSVPPLALVRARPIGIMPMYKCGEVDDKIIAVSITDPEYNIYYDVSQLPPFKLLMINQFFNDYRALENKEVKTFKPLGNETAKQVIKEAHSLYQSYYAEEEEDDESSSEEEEE